MQREIARFSLCVIIALGVRAEAVPWRERGAMRVATSLPKRLIDSIMAQGNWNLLFQEGPFSEFQRQIAIANYFAFRGELNDAEAFFKKAETSLSIAYASLRGKYEWPRLSQNLNAKDLPWGENRETFQDFVLCSLQLYLESGLVAHEAGRINFDGIESTLTRTERQLSMPLRQKDADMYLFVTLLQDAINLRQSRQLNALEAADRFDTFSTALPVSTKNYWSRRALMFRIFENIHYGNLSRARALADLLYAKQADQLDPLVVARIFAATSAYDEAQKVSERAISGNEQKSPENYLNYLRHSVLLQNLHFLRRDYDTARRSAEQTSEYLKTIAESGAVLNEERLTLRKSIYDQQLRWRMFSYLHSQSCPDKKEYSDNLEMEPEWRIKARLFFEGCGMRHDSLWWQSVSTISGVSDEIKAIAAFSEGRLTAKLATASAQLAFLFNQQQLRGAGAARGQKAVIDQVGEYLQLAPANPSDFLFLDWGISSREISDGEIMALLPLKSDSAKAAKIFLGMHRRYAASLTRGHSLHLFAAPDAAQLSAPITQMLLDQSRQVVLPLVSLKAQHRLRYVAQDGEMYFDKAGGEITRLGRPAQTEILFGVSPARGETLKIQQFTAPLFFWCENCGAEGDRASRLLIDRRSNRLWQTTYAEIADTFSLGLAFNNSEDCSTDRSGLSDTLLIDQETRMDMLAGCSVRLFNLVIDGASAETPPAIRARLAMGWRNNLAVVVVPALATAQLRSSLLFDFFQRRNRRDIASAVAFQESLARAEKSFSAEAAFARIQFYAGPD